MPRSKSGRAAPKKKARATPRGSVKAAPRIPTPRPSTSGTGGTPPRRSSSLQGFSHQASPRASIGFPQAPGHAIGGVASAEAVLEAERILAAEVYKDLPQWFDGADYDVNEDGDIIGVAARRFADSVSLARDDDEEEEEEEERPSLLAQRRRSTSAMEAARAARASPVPAPAQKKRPRAPSLTSTSPPPRLQDPFLEDDSVNDSRTQQRGRGSQHRRSGQAALYPPPPLVSDASRPRRSGAMAPESHPLFFHHFDAMTPIRVRLGVAPLPAGTRAVADDAVHSGGDRPGPMHRAASRSRHPRVTFVERFLNPRKFFQLPAANANEPPVDILGWSGVYSELPIWLPATTPEEQARFAARVAQRGGGTRRGRVVAAEEGEDVAAPQRSASSWSWAGARDRLRRLVGATGSSTTGDDANEIDARAVATIDTAASVTVVLSP